MRQFIAFGDAYERATTLPVSDVMLCGFITWLAARGLKISTIKVYLFAVRAAQLDAGLPFEPWRKRHSVFMTLQGARRIHGDYTSRKGAITIGMLWRMATHARVAQRDPKRAILMGAVWAAILVGFFGMLRKDNLTKGKKDAFNVSRGLRRTDVDLQQSKLWLRLRVSKTIQYSEEPHVLGLVATDSPICPVRAVREHLRLTPDSGGASYLFVTKPKGPKGAAAVPLSHATLVAEIRKLLAAIGEDPRKFSGHSLRRGGASFAYELGLPEAAIQAHGNWKSEAVRVYRECGPAQRLALPARLAQEALRAATAQVGCP